MEDLTGLKRRVQYYHDILQNTIAYREEWITHLKGRIIDCLTQMGEESGLDLEIETKGELQNLEAIQCSLGQGKSGILQKVSDEFSRPLIKHKGSLIYQQLFNGKIMVMITYPYIEGYGEPQPPKTVAIYRPEELKDPFFVRHMEDFIKEVTKWEDYDDDDSQPINRIGFNVSLPEPEPAE
ncbi:MAG: hypothetical protein HKN16_12955 [Saprospiraceae bacterium]|nr:hypothetical protein [Saprospiraceae bacterium]